MMFIVASQVGVQPQFFADNLKCLSQNPELLLHAARFTTQYVRLVGQETAPSKCILLSTSREVRKDMTSWVLSHERDQWSVKFDVRDLGGHLDITFSWMVFDKSCWGSSGRFSSCFDFCSPSGFSWSTSGCQVYVFACCFAWD